MGSRALALAVLAIVTCAGVARAEGSKVVLVREPDADRAVAAAETRVAAELRAAGFAVEERVEAAPAGDGDESGSAPEGAFATVVLTRARTGAATEIRVLDHVTKKTVVRRIEAGGGGEAADRVLALRVVELMRASLVEPLVLAEPPAATPSAPPPPPPPPDVAAWTLEAAHPPPPPREGFAVGAGVTALWGGADLGFAAAPTLDLSIGFAEILRARLLAIGPAFGARVEGAQGSATVRQELALLELALDPAAADARFRPFLALGAGPYHLDARGTARAPYVDAHDDAWALVASGGGGARVRLGPGACVVLAARALVAAPRPVVAFAADDVAAAGRPSLAFTLAIEADP